MRKIFLYGKRGEGMHALVDDDDFERVNQYRWHAAYNCKVVYAIHTIYHSPGKTPTLTLHRFIMNAPRGSIIDHKNHNGLDNRKENLRFVSHNQNVQNSRRFKKFKGVYLVILKSGEKRYRTGIFKNKKRINLGTFTTPQEAARVYDLKVRELFGEFGWVNFKENLT